MKARHMIQDEPASASVHGESQERLLGLKAFSGLKIFYCSCANALLRAASAPCAIGPHMPNTSLA